MSDGESSLATCAGSLAAGRSSLRKKRQAAQRSPTQLDCAVGQRIREFRIAQGISLQELGRRIGVSSPQMHRYESGSTRVAASRLIAIAEVLGVSVQALTGPSPVDVHARAQEAQWLLNAFRAITRPEQRDALLELARSMAAPYRSGDR